MKKLFNYRIVKFILIITTIIIISIYSNNSSSLSPDIKIQWSRILDKEKHELFKKLKVKKETVIRRNYFESDPIKNSIWISVYEYDKDGNQINFKTYSDSIQIEPRYEEEYVTDENGNILEAYRKGSLIGTQEFDYKGRIIELINYDGDGEACWTWKYEYDEMDNKIFESQYLYDELIDTLSNTKYEYENIADKILIKSKECLLDTSDIFYEEKEIFVYDSLGREIEYYEYRRDNSLYIIRTTDYSTFSRIRKFYFSDGSIKMIDSMKINPEGRTIESKLYKNGYVIRSTKFEYNSMGQILSESKISDKGSLVFRYHYNDSGKETKFESFADDSLNFLRISNYLDNGLIINFEEKDIRNSTTRIEHFEYEFY